MHPRYLIANLVFWPAVVAQYIVLYFSSTTAYADFWACHHKELDGVKDAWRAWDEGLCFTEEQLWCRQNPGKHPDCTTADCRAEEVRLSLGGNPSLQTVYTGCSQTDTDRIVWLRRTYGRSSPSDSFVEEAVCVPPGDKRSRNLQLCMTDEEAAARGVFYSPRARISIRWPPRNCSTWNKCAPISVHPPPGT